MIVTISICSWIINDLNTPEWKIRVYDSFWKNKILKSSVALDELIVHMNRFPLAFEDIKQDISNNKSAIDAINELINAYNRDLLNDPISGANNLVGATNRTLKSYNALFGTIIGLSSLLFITSAGFIVNSSIELMYLKASPKAQQ
ncbi:hypothetical protein J7894_01300 [Mycoplasmopsis agalactiae]|nr:hypothetical protein [Mycoplasmopsis agalactiae]MCE6090722.1 hypothetical protein [Mycoplasmopsis agalactiae]